MTSSSGRCGWEWSGSATGARTSARNFDRLPGAELRWLCDGDEDARGRAAVGFPDTRVTADFDDLLADPELDAVTIATPVPTHAALAERVLAAGKHCFVEKPLAQNSADAERLVEAAEAADRVLMVGHLLEYHPGLEMLGDIAAAGELGDIHYLYGNRLNLGKLRAEENALWSLGAHDVSVLLRLAGEEPYECTAVGESYMREGVEDVVFCFMRFPSGLAAHLHLSWLDPHKERRFTVVGLEEDGHVRRHGGGARAHHVRQGLRRGLHLLRRVHRPLGRHHEPARARTRSRCGSSASHFIDCVREGRDRRARVERAACGWCGCCEQLQRSLDGEPACSGRLTARRGCCWARVWRCRPPCRSAATW